MLLLTFYIARKLEVESFGRLGYALSLGGLFYIGTEFGSYLTMMKELGATKHTQPEPRWADYLELKTVVTLFTFLVAIILSPWIWPWPRVWLFWMAMLQIIGNSYFDFIQSVCNGLGRMDLARIHLVPQRGLLLLSSIAALYYRPTLGCILTTMGTISCISALLSILFLYRNLSSPLKFRVRYNEWKGIFINSYPLGIANILGGWYVRVGVVILTWLMGPTISGYYNAAFKLFEVTYILPATIMIMSVPHLSAFVTQRNPNGLQEEMHRIGKMMVLVGTLYSLSVFCLSRFLILLFYGHSYELSSRIFRVLSIGSFMVFLNYYVTHLMVVFNKQKAHAINQMLTFSFSLFAYTLLTKFCQGVGTAFAFVFTEIVLFVLTVVSLRTIHKHHPDLTLTKPPRDYENRD